MANFNRTDLKANNALLINDNSSEDITPEDVRDALNNNSDSNVNRLSDPYFKYLGTTAGTTTAYTLTNSTDYPGDAYNNTVYFALEFNANNGVNPTLNINSLGAKDIYLNTTTQVTAADTLEAGSRYIAVYNSSLDAILLVLVFDSIGQTSPGGSNGDIQINDAGSFGATTDITISSGDVSIPNGDLTVGTSQSGASSISVGSIDATKDLWKLESTETGGEALLDISDSSLAKVVLRLNGDQGNVSIPNGSLTVQGNDISFGSETTENNTLNFKAARTGTFEEIGQLDFENSGTLVGVIDCRTGSATNQGYFRIRTKGSGALTTALDINDSFNVAIPNGFLVGGANTPSLTGFSNDFVISMGGGVYYSSKGQGLSQAANLYFDSVWKHHASSAAKGTILQGSNSGFTLYHTTSSDTDGNSATIGTPLVFSNLGVPDGWNISTADGTLTYFDGVTGTAINQIQAETIVDGESRQWRAECIHNGNTRVAQIGVYTHASITNACAYLSMNEEDGNAGIIWVDNSGNLRISNTVLHIGTTSGTVVGTQTSDKRLKNNIRPNPYNLDTILSLETFQYEKDGVTEIGFIAQKTIDIIPEAVYDTDIEIEEGEPTRLNMDYAQIVPVLVESIKDLKKEIDELKSQLKKN